MPAADHRRQIIRTRAYMADGINGSATRTGAMNTAAEGTSSEEERRADTGSAREEAGKLVDDQ